ncbi:MAG: NAD-dependent epimerase/dehydratase family protein [Lachnospiraceae bacterium]|nr:NAD-dependent epimerase/dehydratase family protein [Lachnospiraceae bacterium]
MQILITGAHGFIGKNLIGRLKNLGYTDIFEYVRGSSDEDLRSYCGKADIVFHLAGVNRPENKDEFFTGNRDLTKKLAGMLEETGRKVPVVMSSSTQAEQAGEGNVYGVSKRDAEEALYEYGVKTGSQVIIYRMPNIFGKWSRPNYNSAVATFCHNIARGLPIVVNDPERVMHLVYIDDLVREFTDDMEVIADGGKVTGSSEKNTSLRCPFYDIKLREIAEIISGFPEMRKSLELPRLADPVTSKLYSTYLSFLPEDEFSYKLEMKKDNRGSFTEFIRTPDRGQVSVNVSHPGIVKGQHWHDSKNEKFLVVQGKGLIRFRKIGESKITDYHVTGDELTVVDIPTGYVHCIINEGDSDMVTIMWANEAFNPEYPDTYREEV